MSKHAKSATTANAKREETWVGFRPSVIQPKKKDTKRIRAMSKRECREYDKAHDG